MDTNGEGDNMKVVNKANPARQTMRATVRLGACAMLAALLMLSARRSDAAANLYAESIQVTQIDEMFVVIPGGKNHGPAIAGNIDGTHDFHPGR